MLLPQIDADKLHAVMQLIAQAADHPENAAQLQAIQTQLRDLTGKSDFAVQDVLYYYEWTDLETAAKELLLPELPSEPLTKSAVLEILSGILDKEEAEMDYCLQYLERQTGLPVSDYLFYPDSAGLPRNAGLQQIAEKIISDANISS